MTVDQIASVGILIMCTHCLVTCNIIISLRYCVQVFMVAREYKEGVQAAAKINEEATVSRLLCCLTCECVDG